MIEFVKLTGNTKGNKVEITYRTGESLFAPLVVVGNSTSLPSPKWVEENKDSFLAIVTYEKDMTISPMVIGFYPVKGAKSSDYNTLEMLMELISKLVSQLEVAKVNTMIGPQPFMPDSLKVFKEVTKGIADIKDLINQNKL